MYNRILKVPKGQSFFLFGPRGTGKTSWLKVHYPKSIYIDLLDDEVYRNLLAQPNTLMSYIGSNKSLPVVIDEVQKVPKLLDEVHRLIEANKLHFILTGSSARKLKRGGVNLLAGRAIKKEFFPLTAHELGDDFSLAKALKWGMLPLAVTSSKPKDFLNSYVNIYLKEEIYAEGLTRNIENFARFLQVASYSQASQLVPANIASEAGINRKVVEDYFSILRDLMLSYELPVFTKKAKRELTKKNKFFFFDAGVFRTIRPTGPLDTDADLNGLALETLVLHEIKSLNHYFDWGYELFFWHTKSKIEVDFVIYGERGLYAIEVKSSQTIRPHDLVGLQEFNKDYPQAQCMMIYGGKVRKKMGFIELIPAEDFFKNTQDLF